jgi:hypothetical protein
MAPDDETRGVLYDALYHNQTFMWIYGIVAESLKSLDVDSMASELKVLRKYEDNPIRVQA